MASKGQRAYKCADCGQNTYFRRHELQRRFRPRCRFCGSGMLEPSSYEGGQEQLDRNTNLVACPGIVKNFRKETAKALGKIRT